MTRPINILLIENETPVRHAIEDALAVENYGVVSVANRQEALLRLSYQRFDIVMLDLDPRNENGWQTLHHLHMVQSGLRIIGMTARPEQHDSNSSVQGIVALIEKPLNFSMLFQTLLELAAAASKPSIQSRQPSGRFA